jgi:signal transduction histidine kinase
MVVTPHRPSSEVDRIRQRFERLLSAGVAIFSQHTLDRVLQEIVDAARDVVGAKYAALGVLSEDRTSLVAFVTSGMDAATRERIGDLPRGHGLLGAVITAAKPIRSADIAKHPQRSGFPAHHPPMKSFLGVPVAVRGTVFGNLYLTEKIGASSFSDEDEAIAVLLAAQAAVAVENARLHEDEERLLGQVREMQRQRELSLAMMNHELRNALTGVFGWAERLVRGRGGPEAREAAGREVYEGAERTITLLNNFLDLSRLDAGKVRPIFREVDVMAVLQRCLTALEPVAATKAVRLEPRGPEAVRMASDPVRLEQILVNLVGNAIRHGPTDSVVTVTVDNHEGVRVRVSDRGPGIPAALRARVFEPFERFDPDSGAGTGLGLAVSRRLAELMGGSLGVEDTPGGGATFVLTLPSQPPGNPA